MAIDYLARKSQAGIKMKTSWGAASDIQELDNLTATLLIDPAQMKDNASVVREEMQLTSAAGLIVERARSVTDYTSGLHRFSFGGVAIRDSLPYFLFLALFKVTETDITVPDPDNFQQVFIPWAQTDMPDFTDPFSGTGTAGANTKPPLCSVVYGYSNSNYGYTALDDAILNSLVFSVNVNNQGIARYAQVSGEFVGAKITKNFDYSTLAFPAPPDPKKNYNDDQNAFSFSLAGTVSYTGCFKTFQLSINNNVSSDCKTTGGRANNFRINPEYMVDFTIPYNSVTEPLAAGCLAGTEQTVTLTTGTTSTLGYLNIVAKGALVGDLEKIIENGVWVYKGQLKCELPASGNALAVTMCSLTPLIG